MDRIKMEHKNYVVDLEIVYEDRFKELQLKNTSIQAEFRNGKAIKATITQRIALLEKQAKDATASATSSAFSKFSQQEFKDLAINTNQEHNELLTKLFNTLNDIMETRVSFGKMSVTLEEQETKR